MKADNDNPPGGQLNTIILEFMSLNLNKLILFFVLFVALRVRLTFSVMLHVERSGGWQDLVVVGIFTKHVEKYLVKVESSCRKISNKLVVSQQVLTKLCYKLVIVKQTCRR